MSDMTDYGDSASDVAPGGGDESQGLDFGPGAGGAPDGSNVVDQGQIVVQGEALPPDQPYLDNSNPPFDYWMTGEPPPIDQNFIPLDPYGGTSSPSPAARGPSASSGGSSPSRPASPSPNPSSRYPIPGATPPGSNVRYPVPGGGARPRIGDIWDSGRATAAPLPRSQQARTVGSQLPGATPTSWLMIAVIAGGAYLILKGRHA